MTDVVFYADLYPDKPRVDESQTGCLIAGIAFVILGIGSGAQTVSIALIEYASDPRYREDVTDARYQAQPWGRLDTAVELAMKESRFAAQKNGVKFELAKYDVDELSRLPALMRRLQAEGTQFYYWIFQLRG